MENLAIKITNEVVENLNPEYIEWDDVYPHVLKALTEHNHSTKVVNSNRAKEVPPKQGMSADDHAQEINSIMSHALLGYEISKDDWDLAFNGVFDYFMHQYAHQLRDTPPPKEVESEKTYKKIMDVVLGTPLLPDKSPKQGDIVSQMSNKDACVSESPKSEPQNQEAPPKQGMSADEVMTKRAILKRAMSAKYCGKTRFDYLDPEERTMIYKAMHQYAKKYAQVDAEKLVGKIVRNLVYEGRTQTEKNWPGLTLSIKQTIKNHKP